MLFELLNRREQPLSREELLDLAKKESAQARYYLVMADTISASHPALAKQIYDATKYRFETLGASLSRGNLTQSKWQEACYFPNNRYDKPKDRWEIQLLKIAINSRSSQMSPFRIAENISVGKIYNDPTVQEPISCFLSSQPPTGSLASLLTHSEWINNFQRNVTPTIEIMAQGQKQITVATNIYSALLDGGVMTNIARHVVPQIDVRQLYVHSSPAKLLDSQITVSPVETEYLKKVKEQKSPMLFVDHFSSSGASLTAYLEFAQSNGIRPYAFIGMHMIDEDNLESIVNKYAVDMSLLSFENTPLQNLIVFPSEE